MQEGMAGQEEGFSLNATTTWTAPLTAHQSRIPIPPVPRPDGRPDSRSMDTYTALTANRSALQLLNDAMFRQDLQASLAQGWSKVVTTSACTIDANPVAAPVAAPAEAKATREAAEPRPGKLDREAMLQNFAHRMAMLTTSLEETRRATQLEGHGEYEGGSSEVSLWRLPGQEDEVDAEVEEDPDPEEEGDADVDQFERLKKRMELLEEDLEQTRKALKLRLRDVEAAQRPCFLCNQAKHLAKFCPLWTSQESWRSSTPDYQNSYTQGLGDDVAMGDDSEFEFEDSSL